MPEHGPESQTNITPKRTNAQRQADYRARQRIARLAGVLRSKLTEVIGQENITLNIAMLNDQRQQTEQHLRQLDALPNPTRQQQTSQAETTRKLAAVRMLLKILE